MIIKEAALEDSGVRDRVTGKPIYVSTSARILFRKKNKSAQSIKNNKLNQIIAKYVSDAKVVEHFTPKNKNGSSDDEKGEIREGFSNKFIVIVTNNFVKVLVVKGQATLRSTAEPKILPFVKKAMEVSLEKEEQFYDLTEECV